MARATHEPSTTISHSFHLTGEPSSRAVRAHLPVQAGLKTRLY